AQLGPQGIERGGGGVEPVGHVETGGGEGAHGWSAHQAASARAATSGSASPVAAATAATSSCSALARTGETLIRTGWPATSAVANEGVAGQRVWVDARTPRVPVASRSAAATAG